MKGGGGLKRLYYGSFDLGLVPVSALSIPLMSADTAGGGTRPNIIVHLMSPKLLLEYPRIFKCEIRFSLVVLFEALLQIGIIEGIL